LFSATERRSVAAPVPVDGSRVAHDGVSPAVHRHPPAPRARSRRRRPDRRTPNCLARGGTRTRPGSRRSSALQERSNPCVVRYLRKMPPRSPPCRCPIRRQIPERQSNRPGSWRSIDSRSEPQPSTIPCLRQDRTRKWQPKRCRCRTETSTSAAAIRSRPTPPGMRVERHPWRDGSWQRRPHYGETGASPQRRRAESLSGNARKLNAAVGGMFSRTANREPRTANREKKKPVTESSNGLFRGNTPGSDLLSHTLSHAVPSAVEGLTSVFGMGTGVTPLL